MAREPKISIITPSFNQGRFIDRTIRSVLDQGYPNLEYLVMDGGSTDDTVQILKRYGDRVQWVSEKDAGQTDAINKGIARSTGEIIAYLNSDDVYEPGALQKVARHFTEHPDAMWVTGKCRIIDEQDREVRSAITAYKNFLLRRFSYSLLLVTNPVSQPATFWRRSVTAEFGPFDVREHLVMDYEYWLRIGRNYRLDVLDDYLAGFRVYAASKTSSSFLTGFRRERQLAAERSGSAFLNALHWMNYLGIASAYLTLGAIARLRPKR